MPEKNPTISDIVADIRDLLSPTESDQLVLEEQEDYDRERAKRAKLENQDFAQDIGLKKVMTWGTLILAGASIVGTLTIISVSAARDDFNVPTAVQVALITGVVAGAIGLWRIVAKYLFPS